MTTRGFGANVDSGLFFPKQHPSNIGLGWVVLYKNPKYPNLESSISMSLSKFASEEQIVEDLIVGHISRNAHLYMPNDMPEVGKQPRFKSSKTDYWDSTWGRMLVDPETQDPSSRAGKLFRLRFRLPWELFNNFLVPMVEEAAWWPPRTSKVARVSLDFKILM